MAGPAVLDKTIIIKSSNFTQYNVNQSFKKDNGGNGNGNHGGGGGRGRGGGGGGGGGIGKDWTGFEGYG